jgi:hypothetical protein
MSAIEILKEMIGDYELLGLTAGINNKKKLYDADVKRINALKKALLALESLGRLEKWLNKKYDENWFVLTNNKDLEEARIIRNFIREVREVLENDC